MRFGKLVIQNYGSFHGEHVLDLGVHGLTGLEGHNLDDPRCSSNGAGKSTIVDAPDWCLFGAVPKGDSADSVINEEEGKNCVVTQTLYDGDVEATITRSRKPNGLTFVVDGEDLTALDAKETQRLINEFIGLDRDIFHAAVLFAQSRDFQFADATDKQRKDLLTRILRLEQIDDWLVEAKARANAVREEGKKINNEYTMVWTEWSKQSACNVSHYAANWEAERAQEMEQAQGRHQAAATQLEQVEAQMASLEVPPVPSPAMSVQQAQAQVTTATAGLERDRARLHAAQNPFCPTCGQQTAAIDEQAVAALQNAIVIAQDQLSVFQNQLTEVQQHAATVTAATQLRAAALTQKQRLEGERQRLTQAVLTAVNDYNASAAKPNPHANAVAEHMAHVNLLAQECEKLDHQLKLKTSELAEVEFWVDGFGPKGLKSYVLDASLGEMNEEINRWVGLLTGGAVWVRCETQRQVGKGSKARLVEDFSIRVFRHNPDGTTTERSYRSWSGGEKERIGLGVDFGLSRLVAKRATKAWSVLFLDEVFGRSLDSSGKEAVGELLLELKKERDTMFLVDHSPHIAGLIDQRLIVQKKNGRSVFQEVPA